MGAAANATRVSSAIFKASEGEIPHLAGDTGDWNSIIFDASDDLRFDFDSQPRNGSRFAVS
jgi:hypothetical protein